MTEEYNRDEGRVEVAKYEAAQRLQDYETPVIHDTLDNVPYGEHVAGAVDDIIQGYVEGVTTLPDSLALVYDATLSTDDAASYSFRRISREMQEDEVTRSYQAGAIGGIATSLHPALFPVLFGAATGVQAIDAAERTVRRYLADSERSDQHV